MSVRLCETWQMGTNGVVVFFVVVVQLVVVFLVVVVQLVVGVVLYVV